MFPKSDFILKNTEVYFSTEELENLKKIKDQIRIRDPLFQFLKKFY